MRFNRLGELLDGLPLFLYRLTEHGQALVERCGEARDFLKRKMRSNGQAFRLTQK